MTRKLMAVKPLCIMRNVWIISCKRIALHMTTKREKHSQHIKEIFCKICNLAGALMSCAPSAVGINLFLCHQKISNLCRVQKQLKNNQTNKNQNIKELQTHSPHHCRSVHPSSRTLYFTHWFSWDSSWPFSLTFPGY